MSAKALRGTFQTFLEYHCDDRDLLVRNFEALSPFFHFAGSGIYGRSVTPETDVLRNAIARATGMPVGRLIGLPVESERAYRVFKDDTSTGTAGLLKERHMNRVIAGPDAVTARPNAGLGWRTDQLWKRISDDLGAAVRRSLPEDWRELAWAPIDMALLAYLGYTLSGQAEAAEDLRPLVDILPAAIPLRHHRGDPSAWFVLLF